MKRRWWLLIAAGLPCLALLLFTVLGLQEWWLIKTRQVAVIPMPQPGQASVAQVPASQILPWVIGSGVLAVTFAYAMLRGSTRALLGGWAALVLVVGAAYLRNAP